METGVGGLEMLNQGYGSIGFRNNRIFDYTRQGVHVLFSAIRPISILFICARRIFDRHRCGSCTNTGLYECRFQYEIPTVGQHYGNAFHLAEDDEEVRDFLVEHERYGTDVHNVVMEEHIAEDEDEEEDIEMSTAVEVISIDPNCDYDTDDEEDDGEEEDEHENEEDVKCGIDAVQQYTNVESGKEATYLQPLSSQNFAMSNVAHNVAVPVDWKPAVLEIDGEVCAAYSSVRDMKDELVETVNRSRSRNSSNTESSSTSSSSSSRDSSTSSTHASDKDSSIQLPFVSTRQPEAQEKGGALVHQYHHEPYHSEEEVDEEEDEDEEDDDPGLDFSPSKNTLWELPAKLLQDTSGPKKSKAQPHGRRKRSSASQRQSFSMPHSPVGAGTVESGPVTGGGGLLPTSLSFDDLDSLVCDLSPLKNVPTGKASNHEHEEEDDLLADPLANASNFDLTAYITGDDDSAAPCCETNGLRKVEPVQSPPKRVLPKSRGKELKVLRQHMLPLEHQHNDAEPEPTSNVKRDSAAKAVRKLTMDDAESSDAEDEQIAQQTNSKRVENRNETRGLRRGSKRKLVDDTDKDPTWNPNGGSSSSSSSGKSKLEPKVAQQKQSTTSCATSSVGVGQNVSTSKPVAGSYQCSSSSEEGEKLSSKPTPSAMVKKGMKFGQVIKTESSATRSQAPGSISKKSPAATPKPVDGPTKVEGGRDHHHQVHTNVHRKKTNVKLDHDYCSPKRGSLALAITGGNVPGSANGAVTSGQPRKTIEIPFLLPTKEQLRQERKLQKERKRADQTTTVGAAKKQPLVQSGANSTSSDNGKDKQVQQHRDGSVAASKSAHKIAASSRSNGLLSNNSLDEHALLPTSEGKRTDVNKTCVNRIATPVGSSSGGANEVSQSDERVLDVVKKCATPLPNAFGGSSMKRQVSLLKINQPIAAATAAAVTIPPAKADGVTTSHVSNSNGAQVNTGDTISISNSQQETIATRKADSTTHDEVSEASKHEVVVRKKLNLQEYKKRREHPESTPDGGSKASVPSIRQQSVSKDSSSPSNDSPVNSSSGYSNSGKCSVLNGVGMVKPEPPTQIAKPDKQSLQQNSHKPQAPLDPISAAKMKALRMQQLKKEAAIKSNEVKLSQKTIPLMPILPLAQITSLEFDEHGNPLPLDEASSKARAELANAANDSLKLHPDYEEIIIVSIGCNTSLTIEPSEKDVQTDVNHLPSSVEDGQRQHQHNSKHESGSEKEATRLLNISDTIKRCCPSVDTMPGSSLIASIQEVMIKKSNKSTSNHHGPIGTDASLAEGAVTLKAETMPAASSANAASNVGVSARDQQQYVLHQTSPYVGVSPPSSFSPGKPERAQTTNARTMGGASPAKQSRTAKVHSCPPVSATTTTTVVTTQTDTDATAVAEHGEDKVIMHLRKDRVRAQRIDAATQTEPCGRFPPLCKLSVPSVLPIDDSSSSSSSKDSSSTNLARQQREQQKRTERRRSYRRHRHRHGSESELSDADSDATADRGLSSRSKSHREQQHHRARDRHSHSHSRSRSRHRSSRRRSSCSSGSRSRSRSGYSSRVHPNHQQQPHGIASGGGCNNNSSRYSRSRRKSRTCSRSSSSTSSSRYGSRGRRSLSSSSSTSSMSSSDASDSGRRHGAVHRSRSRSRSPRSRSRSGKRSSSPDRQHFHARERVNNHRRAISPERNIVYVGRLESTVSKEDLQQKFQPYGKIVKITLHVKANGSRYGFVTFEKPQHAYDAIDACGTDPNLRNYDVSFGGRRAFCRTQYADLDGEVSNDHDHLMPYVTLDGSLLLPARGPLPYSVPAVCHKEPMMYGGGAMISGSGTGGESFDDLLKKFKKEICARRT
uniref:Uncharacterized protein n=1 Tax=Anopheles stephensi TaxID=30069 RepID=A0A182YJQ1_ANOST